MIINAGIRRVSYRDSYPDPLSLDLLAAAQVAVDRWDAEENSS
jgi:deoxycytidylate deaminase